MTETEPPPSTAAANTRVVLWGLLIGIPLGFLLRLLVSKMSVAIGFGIGIGLIVAIVLDLRRQAREANR